MSLNERIENRVLDVAEYTIETGSTVRDTAKKFGVSKTTVHLDLSKRLPLIDGNLAKKAYEVLEHNLKERHLRGGNATKEKYNNINLAN